MNQSAEPASGFIHELGDAARNNPVSAALIGLGVLWLFAGRTSGATALVRSSGIDRLPDTAREAWEGTASRLRAGSESVQDNVRSAADTIRDRGTVLSETVAQGGGKIARSVADYAGEMPDRAGSLFGDVRGNMTELFHEQPLALGAIGLAIGASIAAAMPVSETETDYLGETSDFVKQQAGEQARRAVDLGKKVADAAADEARQQGLTADGLKAAATEVFEKAGRVAGAARSGASQQRKP